MKILGFRSLSLLALATAAVAASAQTFDFENASYGTQSSVTQTVGGNTLTLFRQNNATLSVDDISPYAGVPSAYGTHTVNPFYSGDYNSAFVGNFSHSISAMSISIGDFGQDADSFTLSLYSGLNGTGTLLASVNGSLPSGGFVWTDVNLSLLGSPALSFVLSGDPNASYPVSAYLDNVSVRPATAAPAPAAMAAFALGLVRRRRKSA